MIQIADDLFQIPLLPRQSVNAYLMGDVVVDAGIRGSARKLLAAVADRELRAHALTHAHPDHQGASHALCVARGLPFLCHAAEHEAAVTGDAVRAFPAPDGLAARVQRRLFAGPGHPVSATLSEGEEIGGFTVVETPGHTPGHLSFWRAADRVLVAGDAAVNMNLVTTAPGLHLPLGMATTDMAMARASLRKLAALDPARVVFGHGPAADGADFRRFVDGLSD